MHELFCGMVYRRKAFSLISSRHHCQRSSPSRISDTPRAGFETAQNLSSGLVEWSCAVVITTIPRRQYRSAVHFLRCLLNSPKSVSDEWLVAVVWSFALFRSYMMKKCVIFSLASFGTRMYDCVLSTIKIFSFQPLVNNLVTTGWCILLLIPSEIISSNTINCFCSFRDCNSSITL